MANTFSTTTASVSTLDAMSIGEARALTRSAMLAPGDFSIAEIDRGIMGVLSDFMLEAKPVITSGTVASGTTGTVDIQGTLRTFRPERMIRAELLKFDRAVHDPGKKIEHADYAHVAAKVMQGTAISATIAPSMLAFRTATDGQFDASPGTTYPRLRVTYYDILDYWTPGTVTGDNDFNFNIPREHLDPAIFFGAAAMVQHTDPVSRYQDAAWKRYESWRERVKGKLGMDSGVQYKDESAYL